MFDAVCFEFFKTESEITQPSSLSLFNLLPWQAVRLRRSGPRPTPTLRHRWGESSPSLLWQGARRMWPWRRGRSFRRPSTSPSSEPLGTRRALCLLWPAPGPPLYLDKRPFRSVHARECESPWHPGLKIWNGHSFAVNHIEWKSLFLVVFVIYPVLFQPYRCGCRIVLSGWSLVPKVGFSSSVFHLISRCEEG